MMTPLPPASLLSLPSQPSTTSSSSSSSSSPSGLAFCFLPLPAHTGLPVHINGFFELSSNRRDVWHGADLAGIGARRAQWNLMLLQQVCVFVCGGVGRPWGAEWSLILLQQACVVGGRSEGGRGGQEGGEFDLDAAAAACGGGRLGGATSSRLRGAPPPGPSQVIVPTYAPSRPVLAPSTLSLNPKVTPLTHTPPPPCR